MGSKRIEDLMVSNYRSKDCDLSVTDLTKPTYQLWKQIHTDLEEKDTKKVGMKSLIGSAVHEYFEKQSIDGVVQEFSWVRTLPNGVRIGGTADRIDWRYSIGKWQLGDYKLKGEYSAKKFLGIGTKKNPNPKPEQEKEQLQLSIYRWLFEDMFDIEDKAVIYLIIPGHVSYSPIPEYQEVWLDLIPIHTIDQYIKGKISIATSEEEPECDCNTSWMCKFCPFSDSCRHSIVEKKEELIHEFENEE